MLEFYLIKLSIQLLESGFSLSILGIGVERFFCLFNLTSELFDSYQSGLLFETEIAFILVRFFQKRYGAVFRLVRVNLWPPANAWGDGLAAEER